MEQLRSYQLGSGDKKVNIDDLKSQSQQEISENLNRLQVDIHMVPPSPPPFLLLLLTIFLFIFSFYIFVY